MILRNVLSQFFIVKCFSKSLLIIVIIIIIIIISLFFAHAQCVSPLCFRGVFPVVQELLVRSSPDWSQKTMICHSFNCFSIVWSQGQAPLVNSLLSNCYMTPILRMKFLTTLVASNLHTQGISSLRALFKFQDDLFRLHHFRFILSAFYTVVLSRLWP